MFERIISKIAKALNRNGIDYIVIGGQAVLLYGEPRFTKDVDIILGVDIDYLERILEITNKIDFKPIPKDLENFVKRTYVLPLMEKSSKIRVDLIFSFSPFERRAIERAKTVDINNTKVSFVSLEDLIVFKLFSGRAKDLEDVKVLLNKKIKIDENYLLKTLKELSDPERDLLKVYKDLKNKKNDQR